MEAAGQSHPVPETLREDPAGSERDDVRRGEENSRQGAVVNQGPMDHLYIDDIEKVSDRRRSAFGDVLDDRARVR